MMKRGYSEQTIPTAININQILKAGWDRLMGGLPEDRIRQVRCKWDLCEEDPSVIALLFESGRVLLQHTNNAVRAMPEGGEIRILSEVHSEEERSFVYVQIADSGVGMDATDLDHIFDPFFRRASDGLGMGLWLAKNTFSQLDGEITIKSASGKGTTVHINLPIGGPNVQ